MTWCVAVSLLLVIRFWVCCATPAPPFYFDQFVDHFTSDTRTYKQRFYMNETYFGGPGSPIFVILGGEVSLPPEVGILYPWVPEVLAKAFGALVVQPEHHYYGASLPFGKNASFTRENLAYLTSQQALADAARFIRWQQKLRNCSARGTPGYCPILTIGGSYPGFLSAMMRIRYPDVVDMAYAGSAPMRFYLQEVGQYDYYSLITKSAEKSVQGCKSATLGAFEMMQGFFANSTMDTIVEKFSICKTLPAAMDKEALIDNILFLLEQTFANLNMANYPPDANTGLHITCTALVQAAKIGGTAPLVAMQNLLHRYTHSMMKEQRLGQASAAGESEGEVPLDCFSIQDHIPAGEHATARCGDWSGCGSGSDGQSWDYQTCTFEVEHIGFGTSAQMFPSRDWTEEWLADHCQRRFGVKPQPTALKELWGFDEAGLARQTSRIVFTNGLNDGWSVGGFQRTIDSSRGLVAINLPNGAHHSDLAHSRIFTKEVETVHQQVIELVKGWLSDVRSVSVQPGEILV